MTAPLLALLCVAVAIGAPVVLLRRLRARRAEAAARAWRDGACSLRPGPDDSGPPPAAPPEV